VADARFAKPIDEEMVRQLAAHHAVLITIEDGAIGGFAAQVTQVLTRAGLLDGGLKFRPMYLPDVFYDHDSQVNQYELAGLNAHHIVAQALSALDVDAESAPRGKAVTPLRP
jgi:1-deoxy-D-xylulose-5-phosphate synthase